MDHDGATARAASHPASQADCSRGADMSTITTKDVRARGRCRMKIVVVGGSGLIGSKLVTILAGDGHDVVPASRRSGVDVLSGEGLAEALRGASVVVDVTNAPSFEDAAVM